MAGRGRTRAAVAALTVATLALAACETSEVDGQVKHVCGTTINAPGAANIGAVRWYDDATSSHATDPLRLRATPHLDYDQTPWIQVSHDCGSGARVGLSPSGSVTIVDGVRTSAHRYAAVRLHARRPGTVTLTATEHDGTVHTLTLVIPPR